MTYKFRIDNDYLTDITHFDGVSGNKNTYLCEFDITCGESGSIWFAVFKNSDGAYVTPIVSGKCLVPYEILEKENTAFLGCYAECDGEKRISTNWIPINIGNGAYSEGTAPTPPEESLWETLLKNSVPVIGENGNWFTYDMAEESYVDTGFASKGLKGDKGDKGDTGEAGHTPQKGVDYLTDSDISEICGKEAELYAMYGKIVTPTTNKLSFAYEPSRDAYYAYVKATNRDISGDIVIPYEYNGTNGLKPVYSIVDFNDCPLITSITLPKSINTINKSYLFARSTGIKSLVFPDTVDTFNGSYMFEGCTNLTSVTLPDSIKRFGLNGNVNNAIFNNRPANLVVYCGKGSNAESYCKTNNVKYRYIGGIPFELELIERIIVGYNITTSEPEGWATNYTDYFTNTGTIREPIYTAVTGETAPTWQTGTYYSKRAVTTSGIERTREPGGKAYAFKELVIHIHGDNGNSKLCSYMATQSDLGLLISNDFAVKANEIYTIKHSGNKYEIDVSKANTVNVYNENGYILKQGIYNGHPISRFYLYTDVNILADVVIDVYGVRE